ncbi:hypothetical protein IEQ34_006051 [Dendrobium chrysotoxum]|uniref:Uncharacterized protein n=1 Tax=Dendrobium chrysotoxum TaxID=161865 RepID=A0AAV7HEQ3_DENCH|nr:hypothetical protein IEQ34_006051 [Dendrobium chrysotoxum]
MHSPTRSPKVRPGPNPAGLNYDAGVLERVASALRRYDDDAGSLYDDGCVAEDEVDGAVDVALAVELALRVDAECVLVALHAASVEYGPIDRARVELPRAAEVRLDLPVHGFEVRRGLNVGGLDHDTCVLVLVGAALGCDHVGFSLLRSSGEDIAVLDDDRRVAKDEVDCAVDVAFAVELALCVDAERVLVSFDAASVENRLVGPGKQGNGLRACPIGVADCDVRPHEPVAKYTYFTTGNMFIELSFHLVFIEF